MSYNYAENASLRQTVPQFQWHLTHVRHVDPEDPQNGENGEWVDLDRSPAVANVKFGIVKPTGHGSSNVKVSLKLNWGQVTVRFPSAGDFDFE